MSGTVLSIYHAGPIATRIWRSIGLGIDRLQLVLLRFGFASLPVDILVNCDDILVAVLMIRA